MIFRQFVKIRSLENSFYVTLVSISPMDRPDESKFCDLISFEGIKNQSE